MGRAAVQKLNFVASHSSALCSILDSKIQLLALLQGKVDRGLKSTRVRRNDDAIKTNAGFKRKTTEKFNK